MNNWVQRGKLIWDGDVYCLPGHRSACVCVYMRAPTFTQRHSPVIPCLAPLVILLGLLSILLSLVLSLVRQPVMTQSLTLNILEPMGKGPTSATQMFYHSVQVPLKYSVSWLKCHLRWQLMFQLRLCVPSLFWIPCLSFLDASQQIKMHGQIFCPCYIR